MKIRLLLGLAGLAIGFALPSFAQQKDAVDPELMKAALYSCQVFDNAFNNNDPEALANLFTEGRYVCDRHWSASRSGGYSSISNRRLQGGAFQQP